MKHILNNISEEEKNAIREQHKGGMRVYNEKFKQLVETKQGDVKPYLTESAEAQSMIDAAIQKFESGAKPDPKIQEKIKKCITSKQLTSLMFLTTSAGAYALGIVAMLIANPVGLVAGGVLALSSLIVIFLTGLPEDQGGLGSDPAKDVKALLSCIGI
jgi:hypothetical protein